MSGYSARIAGTGGFYGAAQAMTVRDVPFTEASASAGPVLGSSVAAAVTGQRDFVTSWHLIGSHEA
jgi:hypothetical protein